MIAALVDQRYHKNFGLNVISLIPILSVNEESARKTCSRQFLIMAQNWKTDETLKCDLENYVSQNLQRREIINFMERDYPFYAWSIPTLDRRLKYFEIKYINREISVEDVQDAVQKELAGPGKLLGYRAMAHKVRTEHKLNVPRHLVYTVMSELDPEGLEERSVNKKLKKKKIPFRSDGPNWLHSLDGHDKLMGFQNWTFPIAIYGSLDTFSRKLMFLRVWSSNSNPILIGKFFWEHLSDTMVLPSYIRVDKGTETGKMATMQIYLRDNVSEMEDVSQCVKYGPSTSNKIERWWRDLNERLEHYFKLQLKNLLENFDYDPRNQHHRDAISYVYIPVVQRECNIFIGMWNTHRIRKQKGLELPTGVPSHIYSFPEQYGGEQKGHQLNQDLLSEVRDLSGISNSPPCYISNSVLLQQFQGEFCLNQKILNVILLKMHACF